jgi:hypothetical protein
LQPARHSRAVHLQGFDMQQRIGHIEWPADSWLHKHGQVFVAWAIFNPKGPTLQSLGFVDNGEDRHVFLRSLSPLRQTAFSLGTVRPDDPKQADPISSLIHAALDTSQNPAFEGVEPLPCIPSLVSLPAGDTVRAFARDWLRTALAARSFDWGREWHYLHKYGDGLFARAGEETREALELWRRSQPDNEATRQVVEMTFARFSELQSFNSWQPAAWTHRGFDTATFDHWLATLNRQQFYSRGFFRFAQAWVGAARSLRQHSGAPVVVSFDELLEYLRHYRHPIWPLDWSTDTVLAQVDALADTPGASRR